MALTARLSSRCCFPARCLPALYPLCKANSICSGPRCTLPPRKRYRLPTCSTFLRSSADRAPTGHGAGSDGLEVSEQREVPGGLFRALFLGADQQAAPVREVQQNRKKKGTTS